RAQKNWPPSGQQLDFYFNICELSVKARDFRAIPAEDRLPHPSAFPTHPIDSTGGCAHSAL
ncbi:MAG: hypothetical protein QGH66_04715, partial [Dehalococcoidia bacterium]|nr:hypothetical protein [Dehalococcoidia bacterium]